MATCLELPLAVRAHAAARLVARAHPQDPRRQLPARAGGAASMRRALVLLLALAGCARQRQRHLDVVRARHALRRAVPVRRSARRRRHHRRLASSPIPTTSISSIRCSRSSPATRAASRSPAASSSAPRRALDPDVAARRRRQHRRRRVGLPRRARSGAPDFLRRVPARRRLHRRRRPLRRSQPRLALAHPGHSAAPVAPATPPSSRAPSATSHGRRLARAPSLLARGLRRRAGHAARRSSSARRRRRPRRLHHRRSDRRRRPSCATTRSPLIRWSRRRRRRRSATTYPDYCVYQRDDRRTPSTSRARRRTRPAAATGSSTPPATRSSITWRRRASSSPSRARRCPPSGWPTVVFVRTGGGGDDPLVDRGPASRSDVHHAGRARHRPGAASFARVGFAGVQIDGPLGGLRNTTNGDEDFLIFNVLNASALRDNVRQSAMELSLLARALPSLAFDTQRLPGARRAGAAFDGAHLALMGHSMGAWIAPLALAVEPCVRRRRPLRRGRQLHRQRHGQDQAAARAAVRRDPPRLQHGPARARRARSGAHALAVGGRAVRSAGLRAASCASRCRRTPRTCSCCRASSTTTSCRASPTRTSLALGLDAARPALRRRQRRGADRSGSRRWRTRLPLTGAHDR